MLLTRKDLAINSVRVKFKPLIQTFTYSKHVARIAGIDIPREKRVEIALTYVYGIGLTRSKLILANTGVNPDTRVKDLSDSDVQKLRGATEEFTLEGDLRRKEGMALKRLQDIGLSLIHI